MATWAIPPRLANWLPKPFTEYTPEDFSLVVSTNLAGFFYVTQEAARHMRQNGGGQILNISTTLAQQPVAGINAALTNLTKGGLDSVTRALAIEYAAEGIRVNAIAPGIVDTPMHTPDHHEMLKHLHPIARLATVQEIVDAALFLVRASFINGAVLYVDGGAISGDPRALVRTGRPVDHVYQLIKGKALPGILTKS